MTPLPRMAASMTTLVEDESDTDSPWPDLVLIDGGRGQLTAAQRRSPRSASPTCRSSPSPRVPTAMPGARRFFLPGREPFKLKPRDPVLYFVERLRDEAHRFAVGSHRARRRRDIREAGLREIPGIGPIAQARTAAAFRNAEGDRTRLARRPRQGGGHQRGNCA